MTKPSISIKIPVPGPNVANGWGEYHYAVSLENELVALGHTVALSFYNDWEVERDQMEIDLVIRGGRPYLPRAGKMSILWVISHPSQVSPEERAAFDWVYVASHTLEAQWRAEGSQNVSALLQATDGTRFFPGPAEPELAHDILFVGNRHKKKIRKVVDFALKISAPISVYGGMWDALVPPENIAGKTIANSELGRYYRSAGLVLNDHWPDMARNGILSNRMFDVLASGRPLVSDRPEGLPPEFEPFVYFYEDPPGLSRAIALAQSEDADMAASRHAFAEKILHEHSFAARAAEISTKAEALTARAPGASARELRLCIVTCVKNEGPYLLEWIAHNLLLGVDDFLIFSNDCDQGTLAVLDRLDEMGIVRHLPNPHLLTGGTPHGTALKYAPSHKEFQRADYMIAIDVDEFITFSDPSATLQGFVRSLGEPDVISLSELVFGFGGVARYNDAPVLGQFRYSNDLRPGQGRARRGVKSIVRISEKVRAYTNHRPRIKKPYQSRIRWVDAVGRPVTEAFIGGSDRGFDCRGNYETAILNHFTLRSGEAMLAKIDRGDAVKRDRLGAQYFRKRNQNRQEVGHLGRAAARVQNAVEELKRDPTLAAAHAASVREYKDRIAALKTDPNMQTLWDEILQTVSASDPSRLKLEDVDV